MTFTFTRNQDTMVLAWTSQDIIEHAKDGMDLYLTIDIARKVLRRLEDTYDEEFGVNFHSITCAIEDVCDLQYKLDYNK